MIKRLLEKNLLEDLDFKKALVVLGPRQVGKTTLIQNLVKGKNTLFLNGDEAQTRANLSNTNLPFLLNLVSDYDVIVIDEAQRIENIGLTVKMLIDASTNKQFILTGSSSLDLGNKRRNKTHLNKSPCMILINCVSNKIIKTIEKKLSNFNSKSDMQLIYLEI